jgi:large subunit ribosomal protein L28
MAKQCEVTGRKPQFGRTYSYRGIPKKKKGIGVKITGITGRRFLPNLKKKRVWDEATGQFVTLKLSTAAIRTMDKRGVSAVLRDIKR